MEKISVDTRTMTPRVIAQELMDSCGAEQGHKYVHLEAYCEENFEIVDFDGEVMPVSHWEETLRTMLKDNKVRVVVSAWGEEHEAVFADGEWEVRPDVFGGMDADGNPDEWDDDLYAKIQDAMENGRRGGSEMVNKSLIAWRMEEV